MLFYAFVIFLLLVVIWKYIKHLQAIAKISHLPYVSQFCMFSPIRIPWIAPYFFQANHKVLEELAKTIGSKHKFFALVGHGRIMFHVGNVHDVKTICVTKASKFVKPEESYDSLNVYGENIVSASGGSAWRKHRLLANPAFAERHLRFMAEHTVNSMDLLIARWTKNNNLCNPARDITDVTLDVIGKVGFGTDLGVFKEDDQISDSTIKARMNFRQALDIASNIAVPMRAVLPKLVWKTPLVNKVKRAIKEVDDYMDEIIKTRKHSVEHQYDLLSMLTTLNEMELDHDESLGKEKRTKLTLQEIKSDTFIFLLAGHETSATNLSWILYELAKKPSIQQKLQEEVDAVLGTRNPTFDDYRSLKYHNMVIQESLRLHPPVTTVVKQPIEDVELSNGIVVPAGTEVLLHIYAIQRDPDYWPNPDDFIPERFEQKLANPFAFMAFSAGHRSCIGSQFSLIETCLILSKMMQHYSIEFPASYPPNYVVPDETFITVRPTTAMDLVLKPRKF